MNELWSNDRATRSRVRTTCDINSPPDISNFSVNLEDNNMDYIPEQPNFYAFCKLCGHILISRIKKKRPNMDEIDEHFALLNTNLQQCVSSIKDGSQNASELADIARA